MNEAALHHGLVLGLGVAAVLTMLSLTVIVAPYGRRTLAGVGGRR